MKYLVAGALLIVLLCLGPSVVQAHADPVLRFDASFSPITQETAAISTPESLVFDAFDEWTVGGGYLYWATNCRSGPDVATVPEANGDYALHRWPIAGGTPQTILTAAAPTCYTFRFLTADSDGVYFWDESLGRLMNFPIDRAPGEAATIVRDVNSVLVGFYLDNDSVYFANVTGRIRRIAKDGSSNNLVHETGSFVTSMAVDRGRNDIYWSDGNGLWYGRKRCASPPCAKQKFHNDAGDHILLGAANSVPRTVYMVQHPESITSNCETEPCITIRSYDCQIQPCIRRAWYVVPPTETDEIGLPAWTRTGFALPKDWLIWPERAADGSLRLLELNPAVTPVPDPRYSGGKNIALKAIIEGGNVYFANETVGSERIMRMPPFTDPKPHDFGNLAQLSNPELAGAWQPIVRVEAQWDGSPEPVLCTGTLIDPGIVITAGDCILDRNLGDAGWANSVRVIPADSAGNAPFGEAHATDQWVLQTYMDGGGLGQNVGWLKLDRPVGALTNWYQIGWQGMTYMSLSTFNNPGYPRSGFDSDFIYNRSGQFYKIIANQLGHRAEVAHMIGSPALNLDDNTVYGVESRLVADDPETTYARLTESKIAEIAGTITANTPTNVDLVPLRFRVPSQGGLVAGTWPNAASFVLHNYSTESLPSGTTVTLKAYLSADPIVDSTDTFLAAGSILTQVDLDGRKNLDVSAINWEGAPAIPLNTPPGTYWLGVILDLADAVPANNATSDWDATRVQILPPQMTVTPDSFVVNVTSANLTSERTVTVNILGDGAGNPDFGWSATTSAAWLSVNPTSGGDNQSVTVTMNGVGLSPGVHTARSISSPTFRMAWAFP